MKNACYRNSHMTNLWCSKRLVSKFCENLWGYRSSYETSRKAHRKL